MALSSAIMYRIVGVVCVRLCVGAFTELGVRAWCLFVFHWILSGFFSVFNGQTQRCIPQLLQADTTIIKSPCLKASLLILIPCAAPARSMFSVLGDARRIPSVARIITAPSSTDSDSFTRQFTPFN